MIETEENNKLIARFLGKEYIHWVFENRSSWLSARPCIGGMYQSFNDYEEVPYNKSWDWLMPVVEKIESIKDEYHGKFGVYIGSNTCTIQSTNFRPDKRIPDPPHYFNTITLASKIESTWHAIIQFIKWYNESNNN